MTDLLPTGVTVTFLTALGLLIGSFLNVVIYRVPAGLSLVSPGSACPHCQHPVRAFDNIPVVSWLVLRGRCRDCAAPISARYPMVELATGALFGLSGWAFGLTAFAAAVLVLMATGVALFMIDLDHQRLPFSITRTAAFGAGVALAAEAAVSGPDPIVRSLLSAALWFGVYGGVWFVTAGRGMGLGDVALAPVLGLVLGWLGWGPSVVGLMGGFVIGSVVGVALMVAGRAASRSRIPHGPFLLAGAGAALFVGEILWQAYLGVVGLA
jgi:leader peptidase (prepilin peptidase)/N-methyltransferase